MFRADSARVLHQPCTCGLPASHQRPPACTCGPNIRTRGPEPLHLRPPACTCGLPTSHQRPPACTCGPWHLHPRPRHLHLRPRQANHPSKSPFCARSVDFRQPDGTSSGPAAIRPPRRRNRPRPSGCRVRGAPSWWDGPYRGRGRRRSSRAGRSAYRAPPAG